MTKEGQQVAGGVQQAKRSTAKAESKQQSFRGHTSALDRNGSDSRGEPPPKIQMRPPQATDCENMHLGPTLQGRTWRIMAGIHGPTASLVLAVWAG